MKRAFRAAAAFAGAAAGAAAFATAPGVADATPARPDIILNNCTAGESHFVHIYFPPQAHHGPQCIGYNGTWGFASTVISRFCAGNNIGEVELNGHLYTFGPGQKASGNYRLNLISITGHTGNATCP
jgi:hypothetical protein